MIKESFEMKQYDNVCMQFEAAGITYKEIGIDGYIVTFELTKDAITLKTLIDFSSANLDKIVEYTINSMNVFNKWNEEEAARKERKRKRGSKC